jgi:osmoprotectant transport system permease protein
LGNYIFAGLQTQNWVFVLFGCVAAAVLALVVDQLLALMESGVGRGKRARVAIGGVGLLLVVGAALAPSFARPPATYAIGAKTFTEQYLLAALIEQRLNAAGLTASRREALGSMIVFNALAAGDIDAYVDYTGTIWANQMGRTDAPGREKVLAEVGRWLNERGVVLLGPLGFENAYALGMSRKRAEALGVRSIADLTPLAPRFTMVGDLEFFSRPEWAALRNAYGLSFANQRLLAPDYMYQAAANGEVDVISAYTSEGRVTQYDILLLEDPKQAIPPYDAILLLSPKRTGDQALRDALAPLLGRIDVGLMREAGLRAGDATNRQSIESVARWMWERIAAGKPR